MTAVKWRPIATAKPNRVILVGYMHMGRWVYRLGIGEEMGTMRPDEYHVRWLCWPAKWAISPTHWQPLPKPPSQETTVSQCPPTDGGTHPNPTSEVPPWMK